MNDTFEAFLNKDGIYNSVKKDYNHGELDNIVQYTHGFISAVQNMRNNLIDEVNMFNQAIQHKENTIQRYWIQEANFNQIANNEWNKYQNLLNSEQDYLSYINNSNYPYGIWRFKHKFYYRQNPDSNLCSGTAEEISKELSSRYPVNFHLLSDLNTAKNNMNEIKFNTVLMSIKSIIAIEDEIVAPLEQNEIFKDLQGRYWRNLIRYTDYLRKRFQNCYLDTNNSTKTKLFIEKIATLKDSMFLLNRLGKFFKSLHGEKIIIMLENQNISKNIFFDKCFKIMFNNENYITITDTILKEKSFEDILKRKIIIHIDHIPQEHEIKEKLKELLIQIIIHKSYQSENRKIATFAQVFITLDKEDPFIKDFEQLSDIFYINSLEDILLNTDEKNDISLISSMQSSLMKFAEELSAIGGQQLSCNNYSTGNEKFIAELNEAEISIDILSDTSLPIFDPYSESFERLYPRGDFHTLITGITRYGKSFLMISLIMGQILRGDSSVVVFDVHSDLARKIIKLVKDKERLVYINPLLDPNYSLTINLFHISDKSAINIARMTQVILNVLMSINTDKKLSDNMEILLTHCIRVLLIKGNGSFKELNRFMNDNRSHDLIEFAKSINEDEEEYFSDYFPNETNTKLAVRRRISKLIDDPLFSNLMNGENTINLEREVNTEGKIIIFDIPKGIMENTYSYCISFFMEYIQIIALNRVQNSIDKRVRTHVFLDEFQNFIVSKNNVKTILTEVGKYGLFFTMANHLVSQFKGLADTVLDMTEAKFIGKSHNDTLNAMEKTLGTKLTDAQSLNKGEFYASVENNETIKIKNTTRFLDDKEEITDAQWEEHKQYQLTHYYRDTKVETVIQPTKDELMKMIQQFKADLISKNLTETSCLHKLKDSAEKKFKEIDQNFEYVTIKEKNFTPRILKRGINEIFKLAFQLDYLIDLDEFAKKLASQDENDMFNNTDSGTRQKEFTDDGKTKTEQYYYF
jgi:hypothetical protein